MRLFLAAMLMLFFTAFSMAQSGKIAYCSNQTGSGFIQIFTMNQDGSGKKQLTDIQENCMKPRWSPDGKQIVFYSDKGLIYLIRDVNNPNLKEPFYVWSGYNPAFMPEGDEILFNSEYEGVLSVLVIDTASANAEPDLVSDGSYSNMQVLSPSGDEIIYSTFRNGTKVIVMADLNDTTENYIRRISVNDEANLEPDVSPDGKKVVYASFDNNLRGTIRLLDNGKESALSKGLPSSNVPRFSPDGNKIAFVVIGDNSVSLYVMNTDGSGRSDLNAKGGNIGAFQWIDNDRIVYDAGSDTKTSIGIINVKNGENKIIAEGGFNLQPSAQK